MDPETKECLPCPSSPLSKILPPGLAGIFEGPIVLPQRGIVYLIVFGTFTCVTVADNLLTRNQTTTWEQILQKPELKPTREVYPPIPQPQRPKPTPENSPVYRWGGRTALNLTPRISDTEGNKPGLSLTTTPGKGWQFYNGKKGLLALGFIIIDNPTDKDTGHFVIQPGPAYVIKGWTLQAWAKTRTSIIENDPSTWHPLTSILRSIAQ